MIKLKMNRLKINKLNLVNLRMIKLNLKLKVIVFLILSFGFKSFSQETNTNLKEQILGCWLIGDISTPKEFAGYMDIKSDGTVFDSISNKNFYWQTDGSTVVFENYVSIDKKVVFIYSNVRVIEGNLIADQIFQVISQRGKLSPYKQIAQGGRAKRCDQNFLGS